MTHAITVYSGGSLNENTSLQQKIKQMNKRLSAIDKEIEACKLIERASEETKQELIQVQGSNTEKDNLIKKLENAIVLIKQEREQERERHVKVEREKVCIAVCVVHFYYYFYL